MFTNAENYNHGTGRLSRQLAPLFADFIGVQDGDQVLDVGCGTGSLTFSIAENRRISRIVGIDPSAGFIEHARSQSTDARLEFQVGDAQNLLFPEASFDKSMALLVIGFFSDAARAVREMRRVTKPGGIVAACWWDVGRDNEFHQRIWDAITSSTRLETADRRSYDLRFAGRAFILVECCGFNQRGSQRVRISL